MLPSNSLYLRSFNFLYVTQASEHVIVSLSNLSYDIESYITASFSFKLT